MIDHKHLIVKGVMKTNLKVEDVKTLIIKLCDKLEMEFMTSLKNNPQAGYQGGENPGVTGIGIITTSHIVLHTWDNTNDFQLDVYSCKDYDPIDVFTLIDAFHLEVVSTKYFDRKYEIQEIPI